jgi:methionyl-tRNA formyltransferase
MSTPARIAFFGTPGIAATCLEALLTRMPPSLATVELVVCQADKPQGRGQRMEAPPTKQLAQRAGIAIAQPTTLKKDTPDGDSFAALLSSLSPDLCIVVAYGRILPKRLLDLPRCGFVNVHASLLPRWRGAAPVQRAIEAGDDTTGVCLMAMTPGLDEGGVYARSSTAISPTDDSISLLDRLAHLGGDLLIEHIAALLAGTLPCVEQSTAGVTYAHMLRKEEAQLLFGGTAVAVSAQARAMQPWPGASTLWQNEVFKLFGPTVLQAEGTWGAPGTVLESHAHELRIACGVGIVSFAEVQLPNKKRMSVAELRRGRPLHHGTVLGSPG